MPDLIPELPLYAPTSPLSPLACVVRKICLFRQRGDCAAADAAESLELPAVRAGVDARGDTPPVDDEALSSLFRREAERVADAAVVAELLQGMLGPATVASPPVPSARATPEAAPRRSAVPPADGRSLPASVPAIADLLDDMLAQEAARSRRGSRAA